MLVHITTEYQDIVQVYCDEFSQIVSEDYIHQPLERRRCIAQPKQHDEKLKMVAVSTNNCLMYRSLFHRYLVVARCEVQLHENRILAQSL